VAKSDQDHSADPNIQVHPPLNGGAGRLIACGTLIVLLLGIPLAAGALVQIGAATALPLLVGLAAAFGLAGYFLARARPLVYASRAGLDIQWAWGKPRHVPWSDVRRVRESTIRDSLFERCFHVALRQGSLDFYARSDFPELVQQFKSKCDAEGCDALGREA